MELKFSSGSGSAFDSDVQFKVQAPVDFFEPTLNVFKPKSTVIYFYLKNYFS
jgi:hypothetical protein